MRQSRASRHPVLVCGAGVKGANPITQSNQDGGDGEGGGGEGGSSVGGGGDGGGGDGGGGGGDGGGGEGGRGSGKRSPRLSVAEQNQLRASMSAGNGDSGEFCTPLG